MVSGTRRRRGFALVAALWLLVAAAGVAAALEAVSVAERRAAANVQAMAQAHWAARGAIAHALARMDRVLAHTGRAGGVASTLLGETRYIIAGRTVRVRTDDARARLNVNRAQASRLATLFGAIGLRPDAAARLANEIIAWRTTRAARPAAGPGGSPFAPPGRPLGELDELAMLPAAPPRVYRLVAPYLTVHGDGRVNVNLAPREVLRSLPGVDSAAAAAIVARRTTAPFHNAFEVAAALGSESRARLQRQFGAFVDMAAFAPRELVLTATVDGLQGSVTAIVRLEGGAAWSVVGVAVR